MNASNPHFCTFILYYLYKVNLVIDIGNTRLKYGVFKNQKLVASGVADNPYLFKINKIIDAYPIQNSMVCAVSPIPKKLAYTLKRHTNYFEFNHNTKGPLKNLYKSKSTLGSDRLAAATAAFMRYNKKNVLCIDTGTCIKFNFVNSKGAFMGGGISPGIDMRLNALHDLTHKLPLIKVNYSFNTLIGKTTEQSILSGVLNGAVQEINGVIAEYKKQYPSLKIVMTGGNHAFFAKRLKSIIFADPFLLLKGLNAILEFNIHR